MSIRVSLQHRTSYQYDRWVTLSPQIIRLKPAPHCRTPILGYSLCIQPRDHFLNWQQDPHGNFLARAVFTKPTREFSIEVNLVAELTVINPFDFFLEEEAEQFPFQYADWLSSELAAYRQLESGGTGFQQLLSKIDRTPRRTVDFLVDLNRLVHDSVGYVIRLEPGVQTCEETLSKGTGSCRDSAWLLVQTLRHLGLAARFVSGYLIQLTPDVKPLDGPAGAATDFTDLHAWTEVYLPGAGWVGLDPTSGLLAGEGHLPLAATPDPQSAAPITGLVSESEAEFGFSMSVQRIYESPRVTKPYTEEAWSKIEALGEKVDAALQAGDVRLTMGGEPTFVSSDNMDAPEWNTTALGEEKRTRAGKLLLRLADQFAVGPLLHYGQGKWYPGEQLPRWALGCYWRTDGEPLWHQSQFIARDDEDYFANEQTAERFVHALAERLNVGGEHILPGYEDAWYYMWKERRLPTNVNPLDSNLNDPQERERLAKVFEQGLKRVVGYTLPLKPGAYNLQTTQWHSGPWFLRSETMFLLPGDSPMGFRLPLDSLPYAEQQEISYSLARDPFAAVEALPRFSRAGSFGHPHSMAQSTAATAARESHWRLQSREGFSEDWSDSPSNGNGHGNGHSSTRTFAADEPTTLNTWEDNPSNSVVRTAICVEARQGILHLFMPPLGHLENYLHLIQAIEATAAEQEMPVRIEGYAPPADRRITHFKITPDPGVIEVNMQPAAKWSELVSTTTTLYEEARQCRLATEKFMLDGRHTGTGGGNHIVLGGATPQESPFLRRPDVLRSLITYWNNRPSLSYLFSGQFIGPTSQAPRIDEARHESVYEMETAFTQLKPEQRCPPWLVDRALRHLLVDITGNTHRAEFCIDKLYSPDSSAGRLGLVEFRAFEMPPHSRMSLVQQLLVRALVARFWREPYERDLVRWGTLLHDQFMLPHYIAADFAEVISELNEQGFAFDQAWFDTHFEFRFPFIGRITQRNVEIELRQAIEPWHVLGEEAAASGTARYVDSSLERVQVKVRGLTDSRHVLACNGRRVPLHRTETPGEFVAGVRFRAWQPPSCLHPTIGVHAPLVFDLIDTWNQRIVSGCTWHVSHPGGRSYDRFPVNAYEAESRRVSRFFPFGQRCGRVNTLPIETNRDYPHTLDLRRPLQLATFDELRTPHG
jgi:uncharacterized protein (DUF2126 family)/transglutaminase-like putative cysteine protease